MLLSLSSQTTISLPLLPGGSAPATGVSGPAQRSHKFRPACSLSRPDAALWHQSASIYIVTSVNRPGCYQPKRQVLGGIRTHQENAPFHGAREGHLFLRDSRTGPRTVWLSSPAHDILNGFPREGKWVFPSPQIQGPVSSPHFEMFWRQVRTEADIADVRIHDLRHTYVSIAIMQGESVLTTGRLPTARRPR